MAKKSKRKYYDIDISDIPFIEYTNIFVGNLTWINRGIHNSIATYDLVVREIPKDWGFYIMDGLERFIDYLLQFKFDADAVRVLKEMGLINSPVTEKFYKNFKFSGEVLALPEGTIFFPGEPIVRITAPLSEANMLTAFALNAFCYPVRIMTKMLRIKNASKGKIFMSGSAARLPGFEQSIWITRAGTLFGTPPGFYPLFYRKFPETKMSKPSANINHAFVKSFPRERDAFRYVFDELQSKFDLFLVMVDTYGLKHGLDLFIEEAKKTKDFKPELFMVTLDSGDLLENSRYVREVLDKAGFKSAKIQAFSNLDEYKIENLISAGAKIDCLFSSTELSSITDNPKFEAVYKMAELRHPDGRVEQKAKLAEGKQSLPGRKQTFRLYDKNGEMTEDIIGLEDENLGEPLLKTIIKDGRQVCSFPDLDSVKERVNAELKALPDKYKRIKNPDKYAVNISDKLQKLFDEVKKRHG